MADENHAETERHERDERRSDEAHWEVAEAGAHIDAEDEEDLASAARAADLEEIRWESEGGSGSRG